MSAPPEPAAALIWCPFPDANSARAAANTLLDERLIACANIMAPCESHFIWDGGRETASEVPVLFKTTAARLAQAVERLGGLHPYEAPAVLGWQADDTHPAALQWLSASLKP